MQVADCRDLEIIRSDHLPRDFQRVTNFRVYCCRNIVKCERSERRERLNVDCHSTVSIPLLFGAVQQFRPHDGASNYVARLEVLKSLVDRAV